MSKILKILVITSIHFIAVFAQATYSDQGHWVGVRVGYIPSVPWTKVCGIIGYEYRFGRFLSAPFDLTGLEVSKGFAIIINGGIRLRIPISRVNKNIYGQIGFGSGTMYAVLHYAIGSEYSISERLALFFQYRHFSSNFDALKPGNSIFSLGLNFDLTSKELRQSYLVE